MAAAPRPPAAARRRAYRRWSAADDATVRAWAAGRLSLPEAVEARGLTKGQILGRAHRLALRAVPVLCAAPPASRLCTADPRACQWPEGDPRTADFRFCAAPRGGDPRAPYCAAHTRRARVPVADPRLLAIGPASGFGVGRWRRRAG
jgi:GcrA cell cycle regulator